ncbi:unnamed protein product [Caenorhabditis brenneri]
MTETPELSIYEKAFVKTDDTDAILVVDGKKMHVNKGILCYHSPFFKALFNSNFKEKSMEEIEIKDVKFEDFATLLSLVHLNPLRPTRQNAEKILELAERFLMPSVKQHLEYFLIQTDIERLEKIRIGDKYQLDDLIQNGINQYQKEHVFTTTTARNSAFKNLTDKTKVKYLTYLFKIKET